MQFGAFKRERVQTRLHRSYDAQDLPTTAETHIEPYCRSVKRRATHRWMVDGVA